MEWSWPAWVVSVAAVMVSGLVAAVEGHWRKRPGLDLGFVNHGGMWGDLVLLPIANGVIVPHLEVGTWVPVALLLSTAASLWVHHHWYRGDSPGGPRSTSGVAPGAAGRAGMQRRSNAAGSAPRAASHAREHMWPSRPHGNWWHDLSWAGRAHVIYVAGELTLLAGFLLAPAPAAAVAVVAAMVTLHVPLGLLQPRWLLTGEVAMPARQPLLVPCLAAVWLAALWKW